MTDRRLRRRAALEHGEATRPVPQTRLDSGRAVTCQVFIRFDLASYVKACKESGKCSRLSTNEVDLHIRTSPKAA